MANPRSALRVASIILPVVVAVAAVDASGLVVAGHRGGVDNDLNTTEASIQAHFPDFPYWNHIGMTLRNGQMTGTGTYLGYGGWVLTSMHVFPQQFRIGGVTYGIVPGSKHDFGEPGLLIGGLDMTVFRLDDSVHPLPELPDVAVTHRLELGTEVILTGFGLPRATEGSLDANDDDSEPDGCYPTRWVDSLHRWGVNEVSGLSLAGFAFYASFDRPAPGEWLVTNEAATTNGDSGGPAFAYDEELGSWAVVGTNKAGKPCFVDSVSSFGSAVNWIGADPDDIESLGVWPAPPHARPGEDRVFYDQDSHGVVTVSFDGASSYDNDGSVVAWEWRIAGQVVSTSPSFDRAMAIGASSVSLTVTDDDGLTETASVEIDVQPDAPPVADAGPDQDVPALGGFADVTFDGSASFEPGGAIVSFDWYVILSGTPYYQFSGATHTLPDFPAGYRLEYELRVTDDDGETASDRVWIEVVQGPFADAGPDRTIGDNDDDGVEDVTFDGSASTAPGSTIVAWDWYVVLAGHEYYQFSGETYTLENVPVGFPLEYVLYVTDAYGQVSQGDSFSFEVVTNQAPVADAGPDQLLPDVDGDGYVSFAIDGSGSSDPDGSVVDWQWYVRIGAFESLMLEGTPVFSTSGPVPFDVEYVLYAIDDLGRRSAGDVVRIQAFANQPPVADAGPDDTVVAPGGSVAYTLDGSASHDPDGDIVSAQWFLGTLPLTGADTLVFEIPALPVGAWVFDLHVSDDAGAVATDQVSVTVTTP